MIETKLELQLSEKDILILQVEENNLVIKYRDNVIFNDILIEGISNFKNSLLRTIDITGTKLDNIKGVGYAWNEYANQMPDNPIDDDPNDEFELFKESWLWSNEDLETWLYTKDGCIYFEITPSYKWHFVEVEEGEDVIAYEQFITSYRNILLVKVTSEKVKCLIEKCSSLIRQNG